MQVIIDTVQNDLSLILVTYLGACALLLMLFVQIDVHLSAHQIRLSRLRRVLAETDQVDSLRLEALQRCCKQHGVECSCFLRDRMRGEQQQLI